MESEGEGNKIALVFGASGVSGWAMVNQLISGYPEKSPWKQVHALTNRPLSREVALWPDDTRLNIISGIDLLKGGQEELEREIKDKVKNVENVTHVYYLAYKGSTDPDQEMRDAVRMFSSSTMAMHNLCPNLEFVVLQTGAKWYGVHLLENRPTDHIHVPYAESAPRLKSPYADRIFYYPQLDWISEYARDKLWNWCETRPDIIVGFVPHGNFYSLATSLGIFLSLFREIEGMNARCSFPGNNESWVAKNNDSSGEIIARQALHLSLTLPMRRKGEAFNVADAREPNTWSSKWPAICRYFGLVGTGPRASPEETVDIRKYIEENLEIWAQMERKYGLKAGMTNSDLAMPGFEHWLLTLFVFDRQFDMTKIHEAGFQEEGNVVQSWLTSFDRMKAAKIIPTEFTSK
ncbi:MAG: hypothetical protein M1822_000942 [Bathelium mastoideum]|nr:MAG: hypothetical protein M1822_000942 [Bathelium mastoideum]